jgi:diphthine synthase
VGELTFVGLGLRDERDLSLRALETLRGCQRIFLEEYTSRSSPGTAERLGALLGRPVEPLDRRAVESETELLAALDANEQVALVVVGEPFAATTHVSLRLAAEDHGHRWRVLHNASILTAGPSLTGLSLYKFGRTCSLPVPRDNFRPRSPYETLAANTRAGAHSLVLLDLDPEGSRYLTAPEALHLLASLEAEWREGVLPAGRRVVALARVGSEDPRVVVGPWEEVRQADLGPPLHALILPGDPLHFVEEDALSRWASRPRRPP